MTFKYALLAGAALMLAPATVGSAAAAEDDTYMCNGQLCYDDQADDTRALNEQALQQAQDENDDDDYAGVPSASYGNAYDDDGDDAAPYSYGDRDGMYGDDDDADMNPYDNDADDDDD